MSTDPLLSLLRTKARFSHEEIADLLSMDQSAVEKRISDWETDGTIRGYQAVIDPEAAIMFSSGASATAYGAIGGGTFGSYGDGGGTLPVPEPEGYAMLLAGLGLVGAVAFRRRART